MIQWHKSPGYFWFRIFDYGVHAKRLPGYDLFSLRRVRHIDACGWRFRILTPTN